MRKKNIEIEAIISKKIKFIHSISEKLTISRDWKENLEDENEKKNCLSIHLYNEKNNLLEYWNQFKGEKKSSKKKIINRFFQRAKN